MSNEFRREDRYIVIKNTDADKASPETRRAFSVACRKLHDSMLTRGAPARSFLVIESDWPEYEPAWAEIEARMTGEAPQPPALGGEAVVIGNLHRDCDERIVFESSGEIHVKDGMPVFGADSLAPLQAEIERQNLQLESFGEDVGQLKSDIADLEEERDQLKARCDELEALLRRALSGGDDGLGMDIDAALSKPAGSDQAPPLEIPSRTITLSGCEFTEDELLRRAVRAVRGKRRNTYPRWALVRDAFGCGSGVGTALCRRFGFDPEEVLKS